QRSLAHLSHAITIARDLGNVGLYRRATLRTVATLRNAGKNAEAKTLFDALGEPTINDDPAFRRHFFMQRGRMAANSGERELAYADFEKGIAAAEEIGDAYFICHCW